ncbi:MAG TPA: acetyl-CoA carboxylase, carboxyltransferase subunit beta [candidate division Zixibacteria bacterium]|nr:acetyl-CoA carboxylase, carboxyltransferase subunit beta [candidate division Zixibacteria bacterium]
MEWFRKAKEGLTRQDKREIPDGLWTKCKGCGEIIYARELERNWWVCSACQYHFRIRHSDYIQLLLDDGALEEYDRGLVSRDPLAFKDKKKYPERIAESQKKTGLADAVVCGVGAIGGIQVSFSVMAFAFVGGSMGSVVGEKVSRAIERALTRRIPLVIVSCSGGARMQEGILSLMQMAKTSYLLAELKQAQIPFISILTNPTTAGVMASYASLGDVIIAEPGAQLGFAGPRVIRDTIRQELPEGFQSSEFFLAHGFLDRIVPRSELKQTLISLLTFLCGPGSGVTDRFSHTLPVSDSPGDGNGTRQDS